MFFLSENLPIVDVLCCLQEPFFLRASALGAERVNGRYLAFYERWHGSRNRFQFGNRSFYPRTEPVQDQFQMDQNISQNRCYMRPTLLLMT